MGDGCTHRTGASLDQAVRHLGEGTHGDGEVIDDDGVLAFDLADEIDDPGVLAVVHPLLVGDGQGSVEAFGVLLGLLGEARVGGDDDELVQGLGGDRVGQRGERVQVVDRYPEESLDLRGVQVEGHDAVGAGDLERLGAHASPDGHARFVLFVALGVTEVGDDHGDRGRGGPFEGVNPEQQFHEVVVGGKDGRLYDVDVTSTYVLSDLDEKVAVGEAQHLALACGYVQYLTDLFCQQWRSRPTDDH